MEKVIYALNEEMSTLKVINDANIQEASERGNIDEALNACVHRLNALIDRLNDFEPELCSEKM